MSWWISVVDKQGNVVVTDKNREEGGTLQVGGTTEATLNVTYNYGKHFDFKKLNDMAVHDATVLMCTAIEKLNDDCDDNYWEPTEGNVKKALATLVEFAGYAIDNNRKAVFQVH